MWLFSYNAQRTEEEKEKQEEEEEDDEDTGGYRHIPITHSNEMHSPVVPIKGPAFIGRGKIFLCA